MTEGNSLNDRHTGRQRFDGIFTPKTRRECVRPRIRLFGFVMRRQPGICRLSSTPYCGIMMWEHSLASACPCVPQCARRRHVFNFRSSLIITARTQRASEANADGTRCGSLSLSLSLPRALYICLLSPLPCLGRSRHTGGPGVTLTSLTSRTHRIHLHHSGAPSRFTPSFSHPSRDGDFVEARHGRLN